MRLTIDIIKKKRIISINVKTDIKRRNIYEVFLLECFIIYKLHFNPYFSALVPFYHGLPFFEIILEGFISQNGKNACEVGAGMLRWVWYKLCAGIQIRKKSG